MWSGAGLRTNNKNTCVERRLELADFQSGFAPVICDSKHMKLFLLLLLRDFVDETVGNNRKIE